MMRISEVGRNIFVASAFAAMTAASATVAPAAVQKQASVFVSDNANGVVTEYAQKPPYKMLRQITGFKRPTGVAVDSVGNLYVADAQAQNILVFAPGAGKPFATLADPNASPAGIDVDGQNDVVVANQCTGTGGCHGAGNVVVYVRRARTPSITLHGLVSPFSVAYDPRGDIYVDGWKTLSPRVAVAGAYLVGTSKLVDLKIPLTVPGTVQVDDPGNLVVEDLAPTKSGAPTIFVYAPLSNTLRASFAIAGVGASAGYALTKSGTVLFSAYFGGGTNGTLAGLAYPGGQLLAKTAIGGSPWGLAVNPETIP